MSVRLSVFYHSNFRTGIHSEPIWIVLKFLSEPMWINPHQSDSIRMTWNESESNFQSKWIRIDPVSNWSKLNFQDSCSFGLKIRFGSIRVHIWFGFIWIGLSDWVGIIFKRFLRACIKLVTWPILLTELT